METGTTTANRYLYLCCCQDTAVSVLPPDADLEGPGPHLVDRPLVSNQLLHRRHVALTRRRRNVLFPSGVKLCTQETLDQAVDNHLKYFHLRVCQEMVWEAFKIFWDRLPERDQYHDWIRRCMDESVSVQNIGHFFSQSEEHYSLIRNLSLKEETIDSPEPTDEIVPDAPEIAVVVIEEPECDLSKPPVEHSLEEILDIGNEIDNTVPWPLTPLKDQVVELSIKLRGETYNDALRDPSSFQHQQLLFPLSQIEDVFERLPGLKNVSVIEFRSSFVLLPVLYCVFTGVANDTLDFISLQNNLVEKNYPGAAEQPTVVYTITDFRNYITEALHKDNFMSNSSLETQPYALQQENGTKCIYLFTYILYGNIEDEEFLSNAPAVGDHFPRGDQVGPGGSVPPPPPLKPQTGSEVTLDEGSGSGSSGDGQGADLWSWPPTVSSDRILYEDGEGSQEVLPPPDLEETKDKDEDEETGGVELPPTENEDVTAMEVAFTKAPPLQTAPAFEESLLDGAIEEIFLDQVLVTPHISPTDSSVKLPETTEDVEAAAEPPAATVGSESEKTFEVPDTVTSSTEEVQSEPSFDSTTEEPDENVLTTSVNTSESESSSKTLQTTTPLFQQVHNDPPVTEIQPFNHDISEVPSIDVSFDLFQYGDVATEGDSSGFSSGAQGSDLDAFALPPRPGRALTVFFSLRVTNMAFSMDLFNKSSPEYKALEQQFLQLLVPHLQTNLNNFKNLEILNFRNGSIVVNSRMRFGKPVPRGVTNVVYLILEDFANTAYQTMNLAIDKYSLDVESGDRADPCKFQACNDFSSCLVNRWSGEAECVCDAGYLSVDGLPCQSICEVQLDFCLNDGKCDVIPGKGAICRCRVGENWWYRGEHCEEYVSEPMVVGIAIASVAGFLLVASGIVFFLARTLRETPVDSLNYNLKFVFLTLMCFPPDGATAC
uniref:Interphotoreceptor matrix proteoglycan 2b n=1 Tax=Cyclopterus lumpus TaxID=8103 RepID=A0A8C2ZBS9_CYCLU